MATTKKLAPLALIPLMVCLAVAQDKIISRTPNVSKLARVWNSMIQPSSEFNSEMEKAQALLKRRFDPRIVDADPEASRKQCVAHYKAAREALLKEVDALNELIEEEDY